MTYSYDRQAKLSLTDVQVKYLEFLHDRMVQGVQPRLEMGVARYGKRNVIEGLVSKGLLELDQDFSDFRSAFFKLTPKGIELATQLFGTT